MTRGTFELRVDEETGRRYWWGAEEGWKDATEIGVNGVLTLDAADFEPGTVLELYEDGYQNSPSVYSQRSKLKARRGVTLAILGALTETHRSAEEIAAEVGLDRQTVGATLSRLARRGEAAAEKIPNPNVEGRGRWSFVTAYARPQPDAA